MTMPLDLIVLAADADAEWTLRTLLSERTGSLQIRPVEFKIARHIERDPGVFLRAPQFLSVYLRQARYALAILDREGSRRESMTAVEMEDDLERRLREGGWTGEGGRPRAVAVVLDPELEIWVWSRSPHVAAALGLDATALQRVLARFEETDRGKPVRPKEAMLAALRQGGRPHSASIFQEIARTVSLRSDERAFAKLRSTLQAWFPES